LVRLPAFFEHNQIGSEIAPEGTIRFLSASEWRQLGAQTDETLAIRVQFAFV